MVEKCFTITSETGLHARPAATLVNRASQYERAIILEYKGKSVNLHSLMGVMALGIQTGAKIAIKTDGKDAEEVIASIEDVMREKGIAEKNF